MSKNIKDPKKVKPKFSSTKRINVGNHSLYVAHEPLAHDILMSLSIPTDVDGLAFSYLFNPSITLLSNEFAHESAIYAEMVNSVKRLITDDPKAEKSAKISDVSWGINSGYFTISWRSKKQMTLIKTNTQKILRAINPTKQLAGYRHKLEAIAPEAKTTSFKYYANKIHDQMRKGIRFTAITKFNNVLEWKDILGKVVEKISDEPINTKDIKADKYFGHKSPAIPSNVIEIKISGWEAGLAKRAIERLMNGVQVVLTSKILYVIGNNIVKRGITINKESLQKYINDKWLTYSNSFIAFQLLSSADIGGHAAEDLIENAGEKDIKSVVNKIIKN